MEWYLLESRMVPMGGRMTASRIWWLVVMTLMLWLPFEAAAQGKGNQAKGGKGGGPAFCRSGAGHPVFGWEWCRDRGWDRVDGRNGPNRGARRVDEQQRDPYPDRYRDRRSGDAAFDNGYADGYEKGLDDGRGGRGFDPTRHGWYRSADRNYDPRYGSRAEYANVYRDGFRAGYEAGFADGERYGNGQGTRRFPWPF
jgi:hypothetical protein